MSTTTQPSLRDTIYLPLLNGGVPSECVTRVLACVVACDGIDDPASLRRQRDGLLEACKLAAKYIAMREAKGDAVPSQFSNAIRTAIAVAEGE